MTALRIVQKPVNGRLIIDVPEELQNETLIITFTPEKKDSQVDESTLTNEGRNRLAIARQFRGIFPEDGFQLKEDEVYEQ